MSTRLEQHYFMRFGRTALSISLTAVALFLLLTPAPEANAITEAERRQKMLEVLKICEQQVSDQAPIKPALVRTEQGLSLRNTLNVLIEKDQDLFERVVHRASFKFTVGQALELFVQDYNRILQEVESLRAQYGFEPYATLLDHVIEGMKRERVVVTNIEHLKSRQIHGLWQAKDKESVLLQKTISPIWGASRSFIAELIVALEVDGLVGMHMKVKDLVPPRFLPLVDERLHTRSARRSGHRRDWLLKKEIDILARDSNGHYVWIEVKRVSQSIIGTDNFAIKWALETKGTMDKFLNIMRYDSVLQNKMDTDVMFVLVIQGAGVAAPVREALDRQYGILTLDRSVDELNRRMAFGTNPLPTPPSDP